MTPPFSNRFPLQSPAKQMVQSAGRQRLCSYCAPMPWESPIGTWILGDVTDYINVSNGFNQLYYFKDPSGANLTSLPSGYYGVRYCTGAWVDYPGAWAVAREDPSQPQFNGGNRIFVSYYSGGANVIAGFNESGTLYASYAAATATATGSFCGFYHDGTGPLQIGFVDMGTPDNANASGVDEINPYYTLCKVVPVFTATDSQTLFTQTTSPRWTGTFKLHNITPYAFGSLTFKLRNGTGNISNSSTTAPLTVAASGDIQFALTFDIDASVVCVASPMMDIYLSGVLVQTVAWSMAPLFSFGGVFKAQQSSGPCGAKNYIEADITNFGNIDTPSDTTVECVATGFTNPVQPPGPTCSPSDTLATGDIGSHGFLSSGAAVTVDYYFDYHSPLGAVTAQFLIKSGGVTLYTQTFSL